MVINAWFDAYFIKFCASFFPFLGTEVATTRSVDAPDVIRLLSLPPLLCLIVLIVTVNTDILYVLFPQCPGNDSYAIYVNVYIIYQPHQVVTVTTDNSNMIPG